MRHLKSNDIYVPINALVVIYRKANKSRFVQVIYGFNPELKGFSPPRRADWSASDWHKDRYHLDKEKVEYIQSLKNWGAAWENKVAAGFYQGQSLNTGQSVDRGGHNGVAEKLKKLKSLMDNGVITKDDYERKKQEFLEALQKYWHYPM